MVFAAILIQFWSCRRRCTCWTTWTWRPQWRTTPPRQPPPRPWPPLGPTTMPRQTIASRQTTRTAEGMHQSYGCMLFAAQDVACMMGKCLCNCSSTDHGNDTYVSCTSFSYCQLQYTACEPPSKCKQRLPPARLPFRSQQAGFDSNACFCRQKLKEKDDEEEDAEQRAQPHRSHAELNSGTGDPDSTGEHRESSPEHRNGTGPDSPQEDSNAGSDQQPGFGNKKNIQEDVRSEALDSLRVRPCRPSSCFANMCEKLQESQEP